MSLRSLSDHPHAKLLFVWSALDLILLSAGILTVIASICFHRPKQLIINLIFDDIHFVCKLISSSHLQFRGCFEDQLRLGLQVTREKGKDKGHGHEGERGLMIGGLVLGSAYLAAFVFSIPAILLGERRLWALKALNWGLVALVVGTLLVSLHPFRSSSARAKMIGRWKMKGRN